MKKNVYAIALACLGLASFSAQAQDQRMAKGNDDAMLRGRSCATMDVLEAQMAADPSLAQRMADVERQTAAVLANPTTANRTGAVVTIPVVVHVLYNTTAQNVSDAMVQAQIDVLNKDYSKTNSDVSLTPTMFAGLAANTNVQFVLAKRTPTGAPTTGIIHKQTKTASWSTNDAVKNSKRGGDDAWDATKYLNIWVCNLGQGLLGYAQFPGGSPATDGVVVLYSSLPGGSAKPYDKGRTATHEVGHWLNLRHIWGDASCGNDLVSDTPTQQTSNYGCPAFPHVTCGNQGDMSMNYMDYTDDACMYMFSTGQASRMNALFAAGGARAGLVTSLGGVAPRMAIASLGTASEVAMYPNPASSVLNLTLPTTTAAKGWSVTVYDLQGHQMKQASYNGQGQVQVSQLPKGLYQMTLSDGQQTLRQRFEKQ
ncbi:M43 family zinc metalloprotease [Hymenobacter chitinivorans]|uniref:Putative secreted protein (Por secretion system target) n=1 Tax=Hymenobacter chitinivorans DSM 11115 TaxID=1121954 RepID=A0A2M9B8Y6_9BACT|nr:M43 family zinc metalloprotease [Hymenobacter chitinivorans]PJJ54414.1 putative secreted protein (Por secretion system target) [Hymenobacter chitinivorans DSM 11115]